MTNPAHNVIVEMALGQAPTTASPTWTDVSDRVMVSSWSCGRSDPTQQMSPRTGSFTVHNRDGAYNIFNTAGIRPNIPIRVSVVANGVTYRRFYGFVDGGSMSFTWPQGSVSSFTATDRTKFVARETNLSLGNVPAESTAARVARICNAVGITSGFRDIDSTARHMVAANLSGVDAITALNNCVATEGLSSSWFVTRDGVFRFDGRHSVATRSAGLSSKCTFTNLAATWAFGGALYSAPVVGFGENVMFNRATVTNAAGTVASAEDAASVAANGSIRHPAVTTHSLTDPQYDADVLVDIYANPVDYVSSITYEANANDTRFAAVAQLDLRDRVVVEFSPNDGTATLSSTCSIESITETVSAGGLWTVTLGLFPLAGFDALNPSDWMIVGDSDTGRVGTGRVAP